MNFPDYASRIASGRRRAGPNAGCCELLQSAAIHRATNVERRGIVADRRAAIGDRRAAIEPANPAGADIGFQVRFQACQESDRARIAADLHDSIGSSLSAIKFALEDSIKRAQAEAPHLAVEPLIKITLELGASIEEVRRIAMNLRPSMLDDLGIVATIGWYSRELQDTYRNVRVVKEISAPEADIPGSLKTTIFRIVQEAANNAVKHGGAELIRIALNRKDGEIRLEVEDNGRGFDVQEVLAGIDCSRHIGVASMRQRASCSGGSLLIRSAPGGGARVDARWPVQSAESR
jgi:signal transduction histidine kinase